ncbi:hypothetical protein EV182_005939, partial [Spiromyces aspiralis]
RLSTLSIKSSNYHFNRHQSPITTAHSKQIVQSEFNTLGAHRLTRRHPGGKLSMTSIPCVSGETLSSEDPADVSTHKEAPDTDQRQGHRQRSRTVSSEHDIVMVSTVPKMPTLDRDLCALNAIPKFTHLAQPAPKRVFNFMRSSNYIDLSMGELGINGEDLGDLMLTTNRYVQDRIERACDIQSEISSRAKSLEDRATRFYSHTMIMNRKVKDQLEKLSVIASLQRQAEKSYELMQSILQDMERLESLLPQEDRISTNEANFACEFPNLQRVFSTRRCQLRLLSRSCSEDGRRRRRTPG